MSDDEVYSEPPETETKTLKLPAPEASSASVPAEASKTKREKSPIGGNRDKSLGIRENPKSSGHGAGSLALKVVTQGARVGLLRSLHDRVTSGEATDFTLSELDEIRASSNDLWARFALVHDSIVEGCTLEFMSSSYVTDNEYTRACSLHCEINSRLARYRDQIQPPQRPSSGNQSSERTATSGSRAHLPKIEIPTFTGDYSRWISFRDMFTSIVTNNQVLTDVERMHFLRAATSGEAAKLIASLAIEADSFAIAWETLHERYQNDRVLVTSHIESLFRTTVITSRSSHDLHALLHTITEACNSLTVLGAPIDQWDWVLVYAIARRLDSTTREAWEMEAGRSKTPPSFKQLRAFLTNRARALEGAEVGTIAGSRSSGSDSQHGSRPKTSRVHAAATADNQQPCAYCRDNHYIVTCAKFRQLSPAARRGKVGKLRLCFNCLGRHNVAACHISTRYKECDRKHHTMIHVGWSKYGDSPNNTGTPPSTGNSAGAPTMPASTTPGPSSTGTPQ